MGRRQVFKTVEETEAEQIRMTSLHFRNQFHLWFDQFMLEQSPAPPLL